MTRSQSRPEVRASTSASGPSSSWSRTRSILNPSSKPPRSVRSISTSESRGKSWSVAGYCELRKDFRNFSAERVSALEVLEENFEHVPGRTLRDLFAHYEHEHERR